MSTLPHARPQFWSAPSTGSVLDRYAALASTRRTDPTRTPDAKRDAIYRQQERRAKQEVRRG